MPGGSGMLAEQEAGWRRGAAAVCSQQEREGDGGRKKEPSAVHLAMEFRVLPVSAYLTEHLAQLARAQAYCIASSKVYPPVNQKQIRRASKKRESQDSRSRTRAEHRGQSYKPARECEDESKEQSELSYTCTRVPDFQLFVFHRLSGAPECLTDDRTDNMTSTGLEFSTRFVNHPITSRNGPDLNGMSRQTNDSRMRGGKKRLTLGCLPRIARASAGTPRVIDFHGVVGKIKIGLDWLETCSKPFQGHNPNRGLLRTGQNVATTLKQTALLQTLSSTRVKGHQKQRISRLNLPGTDHCDEQLGISFDKFLFRWSIDSTTPAIYGKATSHRLVVGHESQMSEGK
ncbi:hypothetical protein FB45DRAFT_878999 [Roridomyces roridus]|uniref:Uncharacterized protein n=1 Tax=Roridomyces roridus TaxID=1738132 RepID=A0AAD7B034_9AGAR|nr:hypothetical protein FB45DRAFT_878999 [Roridomyces roridus]